MSMRLVCDAFNAKVGSAGTKLVLIKLADNANDEGTCWPSYKHIADQCEMGVRTVIRHINKLVEMGLVSKTARINDNRQTSNVYCIHPQAVEAARGDKSAPRGVSNWHAGGDTVTPPGVPNWHTESPSRNHKEESGNTTAASAANDYPLDFERTWKKYPKREGGNPKPRALKAWKARIKSGADAAEIEAGVERYAAHLKAKGKEGTEFVMQAATFFGPDEHWKQTYTTATPKKEQVAWGDHMMVDFDAREAARHANG